jgi:hypothetical protein
VDRPKGMDFADIVYQGEQPPLYIHFQFGAYREAVHVLLHTDVGKDRGFLHSILRLPLAKRPFGVGIAVNRWAISVGSRGLRLVLR